MIEVIDATTEHIADLLRLLEENAMQGDWELVMTRRPGYFSPRNRGDFFMFRNYFPINWLHHREISCRNGYPLGDENWQGKLAEVK